jgi:hypothetical protein
VQEEHFARLADGRHPIAGEQLGAPPDHSGIRERARRYGLDDGASRRLGCHVLRA